MKIPEGWPTDVMIEVGANVISAAGRCDTWDKASEAAKHIYKSMSSYAPTPQLPAATDDAKDAERYRWLRNRDLGTIDKGGLFAGIVPENEVINGIDLDQEVDARMGLPAAPTPPEVEPARHVGYLGHFGELFSIDDLKRLPLDCQEGYGSLPKVYTSPPSPKAEWSADDEPLNLRAAASDLLEILSAEWEEIPWEEITEVQRVRKFLEKSS